MATKKIPAPLLSDDEIIALYWKRDENAIRETERKFKPYLQTVAWSILADTLDCEECLNDTYLKTWNTIPPTRPQFLQAFLAKITRRLALDRRRGKNRDKRIPADATETLHELADTLTSTETVESTYESTAIATVVNRYLRALDDRDLDLFISRYFQSESITSLARRTKMSGSGVRKALTRLREGLREELEKEGIAL